MDLIFYSIWISLFDSLSTTLQIVVFVLLLTTQRPVRNALAYLAGLCGTYYACGVAVYPVLDAAKALLGRFFPSRVPDGIYYQAELLTGLVMVGIGVLYFYRRKKACFGRTENMVVARLKSMGAWFAFGLGFFITLTSFPVSFPYFAVLSRYSALHLGLGSVLAYVLVYNVGYASPMVLILLIYLRLKQGTDGIHDLLHQKALLLNAHLTTWTFIAFGAFSMMDAVCFFAFGRVLIKGRFF